MKRSSLILFLAACFFSFQSIAAGINFIENKTWKEILALAKKENKLIFLDAYASWCGPCKYLQKNIFTDSKVGAFYNTSFINVKIDMEEGEGLALSEKYHVTSYPTLFFINGDGQLVHKSIGAMEAAEFIDLGKAAVDPERQYFTIKAKAAQGKVKPEAFHNWIHTAEGMEDADVTSIVDKYLATTTYPLIETEMISIIMDHGKQLSKTQLDQIYTNRVKAAQLIEAELQPFEDALIKLVVNHASAQSTTNNVPDFARFKKIVEGYYPKKALLETQKAKVAYYVQKEDKAKALAELTALIKNASYGASVEDISMAAIDASNLIQEANKGKEFVQIVQAYPLKPDEKTKGYYKDMALLMLYYRMQEKDKVTEYADKLIDNENTPESVVEMVKSFKE